MLDFEEKETKPNVMGINSFKRHTPGTVTHIILIHTKINSLSYMFLKQLSNKSQNRHALIQTGHE